jgi:hypothetical protein
MSGRIQVAVKAERSADGYLFASAMELRRYFELKLMRQAGLIRNLELQPKYVLQEAYAHPVYGPQRALTYKADFRYVDIASGDTITEDAKGHRTEVYKIKRKLFLAKYPTVNFREVKA